MHVEVKVDTHPSKKRLKKRNPSDNSLHKSQKSIKSIKSATGKSNTSASHLDTKPVLSPRQKSNQAASSIYKTFKTVH